MSNEELRNRCKALHDNGLSYKFICSKTKKLSINGFYNWMNRQFDYKADNLYYIERALKEIGG